MSNHVIRILDYTGDSCTQFDPEDTSSTKKAELLFNEKRAQNFLAYRTNGSGKATQMREFDPTAEEIILHEPLVGG